MQYHVDFCHQELWLAHFKDYRERGVSMTVMQYSLLVAWQEWFYDDFVYSIALCLFSRCYLCRADFFLEEHVFLDKKHVFNYTVIEILSQYRVGRQWCTISKWCFILAWWTSSFSFHVLVKYCLLLLGLQHLEFLYNKYICFFQYFYFMMDWKCQA